MKSLTAILLISFAALLFCGISEGTSPQNPIEILNVQIGELELNQPTSVSVEVTAHIDLADVETEIVDGDGYTVITQTKGSPGYLPEGNTKIFNGIIEPIENGVWVVEVQASALAWDSIDVRTNIRSVIYISDTLSASYTLQEYFSIFMEEENSAIPASGSETIIYPEGSEQPDIPDSIELFNDDSTGSSRGTFSVHGYLLYEDPRDPPGTLRPAVNTLVQVWDSDSWPNPDDLIAQGMTDWSGYFHISGIPNGDAGGTADPRLQYRTHNSEFSVINPINGHSYYWRSSNEYSNVPDGSDINFETDFIPVNMSDAGAMWCYQYMNLAWNLAAVSGTWPGEIPCLWPNDASYHYNGSIAIYGPDADAIDIVVHEYGHAMMYKAYGDQMPATGCNPDPHYLDIYSCESFAWKEGWASFVSLAVTPDGRFNWEPDDYGFGLENYNGTKSGPTVEGRVVGALLDLYDYPNDGLDQNSDHSVSFRQMWTNTLVPQNDTCIEHYWDFMKNNTLSYVQGYRGLMSIKQNTIDLTGVPRGDCNTDNQIDIEDVLYIINYIFGGGPLPCTFD